MEGVSFRHRSLAAWLTALAASFSLPPEGLRALNHAADAYVSAQLERSFRTLDYYKTILPQEETKYE